MSEEIVHQESFLEKIRFIGNVLGCIFSFILAAIFAYSTINILYDSIIKESSYADKQNLYFIISIALVFFGIYCSILRNTSNNKNLICFLRPFSMILWVGEFALLCATQYFIYQKEINPNDIANKKIEQLKISIDRHENLSKEYTQKAGNLTLSQHREKRLQGNVLLSRANDEQNKADNDRDNLLKLTDNNKINFSVATGGYYNISRGVFIALILSTGTPFLSGKFASFIKSTIDVIGIPSVSIAETLGGKHVTSPSEKISEPLKYLKNLLSTRKSSQTLDQTLANACLNASKETLQKKNEIIDRFEFNKKSKVGEVLKCPVDRESFIKKRKDQAFCSNKKCRMDYHNIINPLRIEARDNKFRTVKFPKLSVVDNKIVNDD